MRKILVLGTGGTISCVRRENGLEPALPVSDLLKSVDESFEAQFEIHSEQLVELDSTNMTPRHWEQLARTIHERYDEFDGFVITHGTDTLAYAAASLSCLIRNSRKPIVLTGSMKPMTAENSDAPQNLRDALTFAAEGSGVVIAFAGKILDGATARKIHSSDPCAFEGEAPREILGETRFYERLSDDVFHVKLIPGQRLYVPESAKAVILEGYGAGGVPDYLMGDVIKLSERGVYIIIATQCAYGGTNLCEYEVGRYAAKVCPLLETGKETVEYAVARARWALAYSDDYEQFKKLFLLR